MASAKEIQSRIKSIQDTMKITNAMYMISSSKMKKAKQVLARYFAQKHMDVDTTFRYTVQKPTRHRARVIAEKMIAMYLDGELDEVHIVYTRMVNAATMVAESSQLLPLKKAAFNPQAQLLVDIHQEEIEMVPSAHEVLNSIVPNYLKGFIYCCLVESYASEHNSRMMAMDAATTSAKDMLKDLSIKLNRVRQAAITQEITEIIGGAKAQKKK